MAIVEYLRDTIGLEVKEGRIPEMEKKRLPLYLRIMPDAELIIDGKRLIVEFKDTLTGSTPEQLEKQKEIFENLYGVPVVFSFNKLEAYERKRLIERRIAFIVDKKQVYIPSLMMNINDYNTSREKKSQDKLSPAAQYVLLYHLEVSSLQGKAFNNFPEYLQYYTTMSLSRAAKELEDYDFCRIEGTKPKCFVFKHSGRELWDVALPFLTSPVKKRVYTRDEQWMSRFVHAGDSALAHYTDLNDTGELCIALSEKQFKEHEKNFRLFPTKFGGSVCFEIWKYQAEFLNPGQNFVDPLSLYLCYKDDEDERVQKAIQQLLGRVQWSRG